MRRWRNGNAADAGAAAASAAARLRRDGKDAETEGEWATGWPGRDGEATSAVACRLAINIASMHVRSLCADSADLSYSVIADIGC